jgi:hypothetical protein
MDRLRERIGKIRIAGALYRCVFEAEAFPETADRFGLILPTSDRKVRTLAGLISSALAVSVLSA